MLTDPIIMAMIMSAVGLVLGYWAGLKHGIHTCKLNHPTPKAEGFVYGHDRTWHRTEQINVEVHEGEVIAVWFRCLALPFTVSDWGARRAEEMNRMYSEPNGPSAIRVNAVNVTLPKDLD